MAFMGFLPFHSKKFALGSPRNDDLRLTLTGWLPVFRRADQIATSFTCRPSDLEANFSNKKFSDHARRRRGAIFFSCASLPACRYPLHRDSPPDPPHAATKIAF